MYQLGIENKAKSMHKFFCMVPAIWPSALQTLKGIIPLSRYYLGIGIDTLDKCEYSAISSAGSWICFLEWEQYLTSLLIISILVFYCLTANAPNPEI